MSDEDGSRQSSFADKIDIFDGHLGQFNKFLESIIKPEYHNSKN